MWRICKNIHQPLLVCFCLFVIISITIIIISISINTSSSSSRNGSRSKWLKVMLAFEQNYLIKQKLIQKLELIHVLCLLPRCLNLKSYLKSVALAKTAMSIFDGKILQPSNKYCFSVILQHYLEISFENIACSFIFYG